MTMNTKLQIMIIFPKRKLNYNSKYSNYPERIVELISNIRQDPSAFADIIEESVQNIIENNNKDDSSL